MVIETFHKYNPTDIRYILTNVQKLMESSKLEMYKYADIENKIETTISTTVDVDFLNIIFKTPQIWRNNSPELSSPSNITNACNLASHAIIEIKQGKTYSKNSILSQIFIEPGSFNKPLTLDYFKNMKKPAK